MHKLPGPQFSCLREGLHSGTLGGEGRWGNQPGHAHTEGRKIPQEERKTRGGGAEFAMGTAAWAPHSPSVGATVCLLQESRQLPGHSRPWGWGLRPPRAQTPTCGVQMTTPPTAGVPGKNRGAGCTCIRSGGHCWLPRAPEPPQGCPAPSSASAGVY